MNQPAALQRQAYAFCAYCPKVCRFSCPVSEATHNETHSAWGKMTQAHWATQGERKLDDGAAQSLYACTGCMRCRSFCAHENEVGYALFSARQLAVDEGRAPEGARSTLATFQEHGNPFGVTLTEALARYRAEAPVRYSLFPGCSAMVKRPQVVEDALSVSALFSAPVGIARASAKCCGYPLYAAGDIRAFTAHARGVAEALRGYPELVVLDPGCAYTFKVVYPRLGVHLPGAVTTLYEVLADRIEHAPPVPPLQETVAYHEACYLGRGLSLHEEPRALLRLAVRTVVEESCGPSEEGCSGGGGLLPRTFPGVSAEVARRQAARVSESGAPIATACPTSARMFERAGRVAYDLLSVLRRWASGPTDAKGEDKG